MTEVSNTNFEALQILDKKPRPEELEELRRLLENTDVRERIQELFMASKNPTLILSPVTALENLKDQYREVDIIVSELKYGTSDSSEDPLINFERKLGLYPDKSEGSLLTPGNFGFELGVIDMEEERLIEDKVELRERRAEIADKINIPPYVFVSLTFKEFLDDKIPSSGTPRTGMLLNYSAGENESAIIGDSMFEEDFTGSVCASSVNLMKSGILPLSVHSYNPVVSIVRKGSGHEFYKF